MGWPHSHVRVQFRCLGNRWALALKPHQKQTYLFRARSFIAKHGVLLVLLAEQYRVAVRYLQMPFLNAYAYCLTFMLMLIDKIKYKFMYLLNGGVDRVQPWYILYQVCI